MIYYKIVPICILFLNFVVCDLSDNLIVVYNIGNIL